jgi:hypothetical protein
VKRRQRYRWAGLSSFEKSQIRMPTPWCVGRRQYGSRVISRVADRSCVVGELAHAEKTTCTRTGRSPALEACGLTMHPEKSKIVYCKDSGRTGCYPHVQFTFLGFTFRPRDARNKQDRVFTSFQPGASNEATKRMRQTVREDRLKITYDIFRTFDFGFILWRLVQAGGARPLRQERWSQPRKRDWSRLAG